MTSYRCTRTVGSQHSRSRNASSLIIHGESPTTIPATHVNTHIKWCYAMCHVSPAETICLSVYFNVSVIHSTVQRNTIFTANCYVTRWQLKAFTLPLGYLSSFVFFCFQTPNIQACWADSGKSISNLGPRLYLINSLIHFTDSSLKFHRRSTSSWSSMQFSTLSPLSNPQFNLQQVV